MNSGAVAIPTTRTRAEAPPSMITGRVSPGWNLEAPGESLQEKGLVPPGGVRHPPLPEEDMVSEGALPSRGRGDQSVPGGVAPGSPGGSAPASTIREWASATPGSASTLSRTDSGARSSPHEACRRSGSGCSRAPGSRPARRRCSRNPTYAEIPRRHHLGAMVIPCPPPHLPLWEVPDKLPVQRPHQRMLPGSALELFVSSEAIRPSASVTTRSAIGGNGGRCG